MGAIIGHTDNKDAATFQVKVRHKGFPPLSQTFPTRNQAKRWMLGAEAASEIRSLAATPNKQSGERSLWLANSYFMVPPHVRRVLHGTRLA